MAISFDEAILLIKQELSRAEKIHPVWPDDKIHAAAVVSEESGELIQSALDFTYSHGNLKKRNDAYKNMKVEAIQTGAMAIRFLINM